MLSWIWTGIVGISIVCAAISGTGRELALAVSEGAQTGVNLAISIAGAICLWSGAGKLMEHSGVTGMLSRMLRPLLNRLFPSSRQDAQTRHFLTANICANLLGLGNAATPMGIQAAKRLTDPKRPDVATDELCRLVVLNTASIQLIPTTVAAIRGSLGAVSPFDILPAVWITSFCSAAMGLIAAWMMGAWKKRA